MTDVQKPFSYAIDHPNGTQQLLEVRINGDKVTFRTDGKVSLVGYTVKFNLKGIDLGSFEIENQVEDGGLLGKCKCTGSRIEKAKG